MSKLLVIHYIHRGKEISVIPGCFDLVYVVNPGAAWGMLAGYGWLLLLISIAVLLSMVIFYRNLTEGWPEKYFALSMIISGIIGNSIDRVWRHSVVDFLDFYLGSWHWPAFNVADSAITVGVAVFIISSLLRPQKVTGQDCADV